MTFADILSPITTDEFTRTFFSKSYLRVQGTSGRFAHFVPWRDLNDTLRRIPADGGRISVVRDGKQIGPDEYLMNLGDRGRRVNPRALERRLRLRDSLVVNGFQDLFGEIEAVADSIEETFRMQVGANLYAGFKPWKAFDLHFDSHDTLIVQIHGHKPWKVYKPTVPYPLAMGRPQDLVKPTKPAVWEGLLFSGDVLYMPRGWWHVAEPVDGPSVHVTFSMPQTHRHQPAAVDSRRTPRRSCGQNAPTDVRHTRRTRRACSAADRHCDTSPWDDAIGRYFDWRSSRTWRRQNGRSAEINRGHTEAPVDHAPCPGAEKTRNDHAVGW